MKQNKSYIYTYEKKKSVWPIAVILCLMIAVLAFAAIVIIISKQDKTDSASIPVYTTAQDSGEPVSYIDGRVPYYENVEKNRYNPDAFKLDEESSRISYDDIYVSTETGIDVSEYQGDIDWAAVRADGIDFAILRVGLRGYGTSGTIYTDDNFDKNIRGCHKNGIKAGVYFYSQAINIDEALQEAEFTLDAVSGYNLEYPIVFDWENESDVEMRTDNVSSSELSAIATAFCNRIVEAGYKTAVYMNLDNAYLKYDLSDLPNYPLWFASVESTVPELYYHFAMWQYTHKGSVSGIDSNVDMNIAFTDELT